MNRTTLTITFLGVMVAAATSTRAQDTHSGVYPVPNPKGAEATWTPTAEGSYVKSVISDMTRGPDGTWHVHAMKNNAKVDVAVDRSGHVVTNRSSAARFFSGVLTVPGRSGAVTCAESAGRMNLTLLTFEDSYAPGKVPRCKRSCFMNRAFLTIAVLGASLVATIGAQAQSSKPYAETNSRGQMASWTPTAEASYAKSVIQRAGYSSVSELARGSDGSWHAMAMKNNARVAVTLDRAGQVSAN